MLLNEFKGNNITNFSAREVENTGACIHDVETRTIIALQKFRTYIRRRVGLLDNGITTGNHKAPGHKHGFVADAFLYPEDGPVNIHYIFKAALHAGFFAIGIYWNLPKIWR